MSEKYTLTARDKVFFEGSLQECLGKLTEIKRMIDAGIKTNFKAEEFEILIPTSPIEEC